MSVDRVATSAQTAFFLSQIQHAGNALDKVQEQIASTKNASTLSVALANFTGGSDGIIYNAIALVSFIAFAPVLVLVIAIQRHLSRGLTMGAVKG